MTVPRPVSHERSELTLRGTIRVFGCGWLVGDRVHVPVNGRMLPGVVESSTFGSSEVRLDADIIEMLER